MKHLTAILILTATPALAAGHLPCGNFWTCLAAGQLPPNEWLRSHADAVEAAQDPCSYRPGFSEAVYGNPCDGGGQLPEYEEPEIEEREEEPEEPEMEWE